jgi:hypothetical protein
MANFSRLRDLYAFPGFVPAATIRGLFGDPYAVVVALRRRRKKRVVGNAAPATGRSTIRPRAGSATSIAAAGASTWKSPSAVSCVGSARP